MARTLLLTAAGLAIASTIPLAAVAHYQHSHTVERPAPRNPQLSVETITDNLHVLFGPRGNIGVSSGPDGVVLIDDKPLADVSDLDGFIKQDGIITAAWRSMGGAFEGVSAE